MPFAAGVALVFALCPSAALCQSSHSTAPATQTPATPPDPNAAFLAKAGRLYYSTNKVGLTGFDCDVHPDWASIFKTIAKSGEPVDVDKPVALLNSIKIVVHARLNGAGSGMDWTPDPAAPAPDPQAIELIDHMHQSTAQTLQGFLQFWTPFVSGAVIPDSSAGVEITKTPTGHTIHGMEGSTSLTEILDETNLLKQFNVEVSGAKITFEPTYKPTPNGLLVSSFTALIRPPGATPEHQQKMNVKVEYQTVKGLQIPHIISMDVVGTGTTAFTFDGCKVNPTP
jgi:hypothetical protein